MLFETVALSIFVYVFALDQSCKTASGSDGYCVPSTNCSSPITLLKVCGYDIKKNPLHCCDFKYYVNQSNNVVGQSNIPSSFQAHPVTESNYCYTPNGVLAKCVEIHNCPQFLASLSTRNFNKRFLQDSECGRQGIYIMVCCGADMTYKETENQVNVIVNPLVPYNNCGLETVNTNQAKAWPIMDAGSNTNFTLVNRIFGGNDSGLTEFPWIAIIQYRLKPGQQGNIICGGSLISSRYVLTAAHCIQENQAQNIMEVRLGEWSIKNPGKNCISNRCIEGSIKVGVESLHPHPNYNGTSSKMHHDIGLVRLNTEVKFTGTISPVCLPNINEHLYPGDRVIISGFGLKSYNEQGNIKQKVDLPVVATSKCSMMFGKITSGVNQLEYSIDSGQFCAGGELGKDACIGDSGSPLMKQRTYSSSPPRWSVEGIVSYGFGCGGKDLYGVYTKVSKYIDWIHKTIVP